MGFNIIEWLTKRGLKKAMNQAITKGLEHVEKKLQDKTPEDTKKLVGNYKFNITLTNDGASGTVYNPTPYLKYVEYGQKGKTYKYHKPKGVVFYTGQGANIFGKTKEELKSDQELIDIMQQAINNNLS